METVFGITWPKALPIEVVLGFFAISIVIGFYALLRYNQYLQKKKAQEYQLFVFKTKQLGLTNIQNKLLTGLVTTAGLSDAGTILENSELFESAIGKYLNFLRTKQEKPATITSICRELMVTYGKLYQPVTYRSSLESINEIEINVLLFIEMKNNAILIGKIIAKDNDKISIKLFRDINTIFKAEPDMPLHAYLWRTGDAEYTFSSKILSVGDNTLNIAMPQEFTRGKEVRRPYLDVIVPCTISDASGAPLDTQTDSKKGSADLNAVIYKLHEDELIVRLPRKLDYKKTYSINFTLSDFKVKVGAIIISDRTLQEENVFYISFRYKEISEAAKNIIKNYITEHL